MKLILMSGGSGKTLLIEYISKCNNMVLSADSKRSMFHLQGDERKC